MGFSRGISEHSLVLEAEAVACSFGLREGIINYPSSLSFSSHTGEWGTGELKAFSPSWQFKAAARPPKSSFSSPEAPCRSTQSL